VKSPNKQALHIHWARHNSRLTFESTSGRRRVARLQPDVGSRNKVELIDCGDIINWVLHDYKATLKPGLRKDCIFREPRMPIYKVTQKYLKSQNFQTKQMQLATITLKTVYTQWAHIKWAEVWDDQEMFQIFRSHVFFPESCEFSWNSETYLKLKASRFHTNL